jgi:hypothetical protein
VAQLLLVLEPPAGGPRAPITPLPLAGPSLPAAELRATPVHPLALPEQSSVAFAMVQLDAPGTVGAPEFAEEPGAAGTGAAGWSCCGWEPCGASPVVPALTVALPVERSVMIGAITFAEGSDEAPELVTARHTPPVTPSQEPWPCEPRAADDTSGSAAFAALVTEPVQAISPAQVIAAPAAEAADGPAGRRAGFTCCGPPERASAAPGPLEAVETDRTVQPAVAPVQDAVPSDLRVTVPSQADVLVRTEPVHGTPGAHISDPFAVAVDDGPVVGWPGSGSPVAGSVTTKSFALEAPEVVVAAHPPPATVHCVDAEVPRAFGATAVSRALVAEVAVPPHSVAAPAH